ncbi:MAG: glycosyltransferase family 4 protein [Deltaproteobacteria bacterium]|nr:glycosyltransferase family 4 protein [Deltaproteobacteria bacterium]
MRVLHVIQRYPPAIGGSELWAAQVARHQVSQGWKATVMTLAINLEDEYWALPEPAARNIDLGPADDDHGVRVLRYPRTLLNPFKIKRSTNPVLSRPGLDPVFDLFFSGPHSLELYGALPLEAARHDVIHVHAFPYPHNRAGIWTARLLGKPVVCTPHFHPGLPGFESGRTLRLLRRCGAVFCVSRWEQDYLAGKGLLPARLVVTGNGIDRSGFDTPLDPLFRYRLERTHQIPADAPLAAVISRKVPQKGMAFLFDIAREIVRRGLPVRIAVAGPPSAWFDDIWPRQPASVRSVIADVGPLTTRDKIQLLRHSRMLLLPSRHEAFGIVMLEAWAAGIPVVTTDSGALPSIVNGGGLTAPYDNSPAFVDCIERFLRDETLARAAARAGANQMDTTHRWDRIGDTVMETVERVAKPETQSTIR